MSGVARRVTKRTRAELATSTMNHDAAATDSASSHQQQQQRPQLIESVEEVIETQSILLRFPCFDFFRTVHLCELQPGVDEGDEPSAVTASSFQPTAVQFVPGTLTTAHPIVVVNAGTASEMVFVGSWQERVPAGGRTNRAIVHLTADATGASPSVATKELPETNFSQTVVPSLLTHPEGGVTADEERARRARARGGEWCYDSVDVPVAVLLLQRYK